MGPFAFSQLGLLIVRLSSFLSGIRPNPLFLRCVLVAPFAELKRSFTMAIALPVPQISISPAPPEESFDEPFSPFPWSPVPDDVDSFRPKHLTPPLACTKFIKQQSPLRPDAPKASQGKGLEPERFQALLKASRERNAATVGVKPTDLRKSVAIKAHRNKQSAPQSPLFYRV